MNGLFGGKGVRVALSLYLAFCLVAALLHFSGQKIGMWLLFLALMPSSNWALSLGGNVFVIFALGLIQYTIIGVLFNIVFGSGLNAIFSSMENHLNEEKNGDEES